MGILKLYNLIYNLKYGPLFIIRKYTNIELSVIMPFGHNYDLNKGQSRIENDYCFCLIHFHTHALDLLVTLPKVKSI